MQASTPRAASAAVIKLFTKMNGVDPKMLQEIENGTYTVDPHAVADAILRRSRNLAEARRLSVLITAQRDDSAIWGTQFDEPCAGMDVA
jgi:hypothetical protein